MNAGKGMTLGGKKAGVFNLYSTGCSPNPTPPLAFLPVISKTGLVWVKAVNRGSGCMRKWAPRLLLSCPRIPVLQQTKGLGTCVCQCNFLFCPKQAKGQSRPLFGETSTSPPLLCFHLPLSAAAHLHHDPQHRICGL